MSIGPATAGTAIGSTDLEPSPSTLALWTAAFSKVTNLRDHRSLMNAGTVHAEAVVDALDRGDTGLAVEMVRVLVAHIRAGRTRWHELDGQPQGAR